MTDVESIRDEDADISLKEAVARTLRADKDALARALAAEVMRDRANARRRIDAIRKELENGARAGAGQFRL